MLKRKHMVILALGCLIVATLGWSVLRHNGGGAAATDPTTVGVAGVTVDVDDLMKHVERYDGTIRVKGVVSGVLPEERMLSLIDLREWQECGVTTCATLTLPVAWKGDLPSVRDVIFIDGRIQDADGKLVFVADKLEKAPPVNGGSS